MITLMKLVYKNIFKFNLALAKQTENHQLDEMRRIAAYLYRKA